LASPAPRCLSLREAAEVLGLPVSAVRDLVGKRRLPVVRVSERRLRVKESDLAAYIERRTIQAVV
jgi:excisionase family DNA binding protein